jgi:H+ antiporter protein
LSTVSVPTALAPLRNRDYRLLFAALAISLTGDGIWVVAIAFQVIELGGGPVQLSLVVACFSVGLIGFILVGGIVADRLPRRQVMLTADIVRAAVVAIVAILALTEGLEIWMLGLAGFVVGAGESFFIPSYTGLVPHLVPEEQILAANGLEGTLRPLAEFAAGPALGGIAVAALSPGAAIMFDAATFAVSAACLLAIRTQGTAEREPGEAGVGQAIADLREGGRYVRRTPWLWTTLLFALIAVLFLIGPIDVLIPFAVSDRLDAGAGAYGTLLAAFGVGSAAGALLIASRPFPGRYLTVMLLVWGFGALPIAAIGIANQLWVMVIAMVIVGVTSGIGDVIWGTLLQRRVPDELRGRVSSLDFFVSLGLLPISMVLAGPAADAFGITTVFIVAGLVPAVLGPLALIAGRLRADEAAHPLR